MATTEIVFSAMVLKKLQEHPRKASETTWVLLGTDESGIVIDFEPIGSSPQCYTPQMDSSETAKAIIALFKRGMTSVGIYIMDGQTFNRRSGPGTQFETVAQWYGYHQYAFQNKDMLAKDLIYVKEGLRDRTQATAGIILAGQQMAALAIKIVEKIEAKLTPVEEIMAKATVEKE